jgi:hypothetical protein
MPPAEQRLAAVWLAAHDRNAVTKAAYEIDLVLEMFPNAVGENLFDHVREYTQPPLTVEYEVDEVNHCIYVLNVWNTANGRPNAMGT